jgi:phosphoribosylamine--glycine ligase
MATGGRVLSVVAVGESFSAARKSAYEVIKQIQLEGSHYRTDIALKVDEERNV